MEGCRGGSPGPGPGRGMCECLCDVASALVCLLGSSVTLSVLTAAHVLSSQVLLRSLSQTLFLLGAPTFTKHFPSSFPQSGPVVDHPVLPGANHFLDGRALLFP